MSTDSDQELPEARAQRWLNIFYDDSIKLLYDPRNEYKTMLAAVDLIIDDCKEKILFCLGVDRKEMNEWKILLDFHQWANNKLSAQTIVSRSYKIVVINCWKSGIFDGEKNYQIIDNILLELIHIVCFKKVRLINNKEFGEHKKLDHCGKLSRKIAKELSIIFLQKNNLIM